MILHKVEKLNYVTLYCIITLITLTILSSLSPQRRTIVETLNCQISSQISFFVCDIGDCAAMKARLLE